MIFYVVCSYEEEIDKWRYLAYDEDGAYATDILFDAIRFQYKQAAIKAAKEEKYLTEEDEESYIDRLGLEELYKYPVIIKTFELNELEDEVIDI